MPVDPLLQPVLDAMNAQQIASAKKSAELEAGIQVATAPGLGALADDAPEVASIVDHRVPAPDGEITVRVYTPFGTGPFPVHLFLHGGSFWLGALDESSIWKKQISTGIKDRLPKPTFGAVDYAAEKILTHATVGLLTFGIVITVWEVSGSVRGTTASSFWSMAVGSSRLASAGTAPASRE